MRKLASVRRILDIQPIEGADKIVRAQIDGWWVVTAIDNGFKVGDLVCYMEVDSFVPSEVAPFLTKPGQFPKEFNGVKGERLRTIRLRGCLSQGLIIPLDGLNVAYRVEDGMDLTEILKVQQWEAPIAACLAGQAEGSFPGWIRKTDQERCISGDTLIETTNGPMRIDEIVNNKLEIQVLSFNHVTGTIEPKQIVDWSRMCRRDCWVKITLKSGKELVCTDNHRVWCDDIHAYRRATKIQPGQKVIIKTEAQVGVFDK